MKWMTAWLAGIGIFAGTQTITADTNIVITSLGGNGSLSWTSSVPGALEYQVEWASSLNGPWTNSWLGLDRVFPTNSAYTVHVPMFYRVTAVTNNMTWTYFNGPSDSTQDIAFDGTNLWAVSYASLYYLNLTNGSVIRSITPPGIGEDLQGLTVDGQGKLWVVSYQTDSAYKINPSNGEVEDSWLTGGPTPIGLTYVPYEANGGPTGSVQQEEFIVSDEDGHRYVTEITGPRKGADDGETPFGAGVRNIHYFNNADEPDYIYMTMFGSKYIVRFLAETWELDRIFNGPTDYAKGITSDGTFLYVSDWSNGRIYKAKIPPRVIR